MVAPPSTQGAAFHPSLLRPGEGERPPVPRIASRPLLARSAMQDGGRAIVASRARGVWHVLRVSRGAPTNLACEGRVACLARLARGAC